MARTLSSMMPLGTKAPNFTLPEGVQGQEITLWDTQLNKGAVVMFICNHCPFVKHLESALVEVARDYMSQGIQFFAISSNDAIQYPEDGPSEMKKVAQHHNYPFPYLYDESQEVAKAYDATCTPDFFIFDQDLKCVYRGQFDDSRPNSTVPVTGKDLRNALDSLLSGKPITPDQKPSMGCNIKWKEL